MDALERAREVAAAWDERLRADLPADLEIFDAHTHLGTDIDGMVARYEELIGSMDRYGISRAFMFCMDEPDRHPAFRAANDRTLAYAERSDGRLIPFVRLDLAEQLPAEPPQERAVAPLTSAIFPPVAARFIVPVALAAGSAAPFVPPEASWTR